MANQDFQNEYDHLHDTTEVHVPSDYEVQPHGLHDSLKPYYSLIVFAVATVLTLLGELGIAVSVTQDTLVNTILLIIILVSGIYAWWKNNDVTTTAKKRTEVADQAVPKK